MKKHLCLIMMLVALFTTQVAMAQAPVATAEEAITALLERIGGSGTADRFAIVIDEALDDDTDGKDVFVITAQDGKPCIKGNNQLSVATGINWYLNHYLHINLTWNNLTTDLSAVTLTVPTAEEKHVCSATYRYDFNTCTFSYSMAFWTWERWQQEIDWMALHGINAPLNLVGLDVVTRKFLKELGVSDADINAYIAGPGFIAWFAMNNLEGWGGTINANDVTMNGNPEWWYARQENLCKKMLQRMRELGMQPVIPGFSGQVPNCIVNYTIDGFSSGDVINNGTWAGGYTRPDILAPSSSSYETLAPIYYKHLETVMGVSELYSMDPFHEGSLPSGVTNANCYPNIMKHLDTYHNAVAAETKTKYKVTTLPKWIIQYWQGVPQSGAFTAMKDAGYTDRFIALDLFADNIYAGNAAKWRTTYYDTCPYIYCMLHNFGGRSGLHGRLETTMNGYFEALAMNNNCQGVGATPEGTETNPILYDMLFELPWMDVNSRPTVDKWLEDYAYSRYGVENETALAALQNLKKSVWNCERNQQGTSEAIILGRPRWTFGDGQRNDGTSLEGTSVSSWSVSSIYWDTQDVRLAADQLISIADLVTTNDGIANYDYDVIEVVRQSMCDLAYEILPLIKSARNSGDNAEYERLYKLFLQLMLDLDTMLSYDANFKLERWTSLARNIADEGTALGYTTTDNDRNWLEWNARTQVTVWSGGNNGLNDYSNRCWAGLIKDFHYPRWKYFFENNGAVKDGNWFTSEKAWTVDFTNYDYSEVTIPTDMTATKKAVETFGNYFGRVKGAAMNYIFPMGVTTNATKSDVVPEVYRGQTVTLPLTIGKEVTVSSVQIDLNGDGAMGSGETLTATDMSVEIPADAAIGKTKAIVTFSDGTVITFNLAIIVDITEDRTVTVATADANMGSVAIEGDDDADGSITNMEAVKITATPLTGYNFKDWTDGDDNVVSNDNPYIYYGEENATFTANFVEDLWGVVECNGSFSGDIAGYKQFIHNLTFAYYNRDAETIFETTTAPTQIFNTIPQIINVPRGASFTVKYDNGDSNGLQYCYFRAYIDLNADGDFDDEGELLKEVGTNGATNTAVCSNTMNVLLPYDAPLGITHMRLRFDGAWDNNNNPSGLGAKDASIRPVYEIILNITEGSNKAAHITVESNNPEWGTAEVWTEETPGWTAGSEWDVSAGIYAKIKATPATADVEFLGWYDHYGRLLTTELEYSMLAKEDATYTARFRKFLEIDGWQIEYRTEPGAMKTNKLATGVKPEDGKTYYIYAPTRPDNAGDYVNRYLFNNNGTLTATTDAPTGDYYYWTCSVDGENYTFRNVGDPTKYLAYKVVAASPYNFSLGTGTTYYEGITIYAQNDSRFIVINDNGGGFNQSTRAHDQSTEDYTTDFVFTEVSYPDNIILTNVRQSGDHDLVIPAEVEILGEQCTITGFDNGLFTDNKDLWSITLPQSMEFLSVKSLVSGTMTGTVESGAGTTNSQYYTVYNLDETLVASEGFEITVKGTSDGSTFNQWGSGLFASGTDPLASEYSGGFQFYLGSGGNFVLKVDGSTEEALDNSNCKVVAGTPFTATIRYENGTLTIAVDNGAGQTGTYAKACTINNISAFSAAIPKGITLNVNVESLSGKEVDPFAGCNNLCEIAIDGTCANYYVNDSDGGLYNSSDVLVSMPAGKEKEDELRALGELIDNTEALIEEVAASVNPTGNSTEISMTTTEGDSYYIWCSNPHDSGDDAAGGVAALLDEDNATYLHTDYTNVSSTNDFLQVELGAGNELLQFKIGGVQRSGASYDFPKTIEILGSADKTTWTPIDTVNNITQTAGASWMSDAVIPTTKYSYLRFVVTTGDNRKYFHMAKFDLYKVTSSVEVKDLYKNLAGVTDDETTTVYDKLVEALYFYNNGGTADEMQAAYNALQSLYTALKAKKDKVFNGVYNINFGGEPMFIAYAAADALTGLTGAGNAGFRLFDGTTTNSGDNSTIHNNAIAAKVAADALFTIVPNSDNSGYTLQAQGQYMRATGVHSQWDIQAFDTDVANAGVYLFEETATADVFKLKSTINIHQGNANTNYVNDWGPVFGCDNSDKENLSTFTVTPVTEYTLTVPASGVTTLCLPFNVVLPAGVTAYDLAKENITATSTYYIYNLVEVATEGDVLAKNTPVIIKATAGDYTLAITMNSEGVKASTEGTVLRSGIAKTTIAAGNKYLFDGVDFNIVTAETEIPANQCWMELDENLGDVIYEVAPPVIYTTDENNPVLYKTIIKRADDGSKVLAYDYATGKVSIQATDVNSSWQAWYFMKSTNGIAIKPFNGNGKVLGVSSTGDARESATIAETVTYSEWDFSRSTVSGCTDYYYIYVNGTSHACLSHNGGFGVTDKMGIWSGGWNTNDGGSLFRFTEISDINVFDYTLTVPESGIATLYLPYNVVLPAGVTAYTVEPANIRQNLDGSYGYELTEVAAEGQKLAKGTPVIIKATAGDYTFTATADNTDALSPATSAIVGTYFDTTVNSDDATKRYSATVEDGNLVFTAITAETAAAANSCWLETTIDTDKIGLPKEATEVLDGKIYRIKGRLSDGTLHTLYTDGSNNRIRWTADETKTDATTLFVAQENVESGKFKFVSALANGIWGQDANLTENGVELTISNGTVNGTFMIVGENNRLFCVDGEDLDYYSNVGTGGATVNTTVTTDFVFEEVTDAAVSYTLSMKSSSNWATLYLPYAVEVPGDLVAYYAHTPGNGYVQLRDLGGIVPAYTPVVIGRTVAANALDVTINNYEFTYTTEACSVDYSSLGKVLDGRLIETFVEEPGNNCYVILTINESEAFYWIYKEYDVTGKYIGKTGTHFKCSANKAYMTQAAGSGAASYSFHIEGTTGIEDVVEEGSEVKAVYDLQGRKITEITSPGVYIIDGKTVIVK